MPKSKRSSRWFKALAAASLLTSSHHSLNPGIVTPHNIPVTSGHIHDSYDLFNSQAPPKQPAKYDFRDFRPTPPIRYRIGNSISFMYNGKQVYTSVVSDNEENYSPDVPKKDFVYIHYRVDTKNLWADPAHTIKVDPGLVHKKDRFITVTMDEAFVPERIGSKTEYVPMRTWYRHRQAETGRGRRGKTRRRKGKNKYTRRR